MAPAALCHHNSRSVGLPEAFYPKRGRFRSQTSDRLPVATPCVIIDRDGEVHILCNATTEGIADALPRVRYKTGPEIQGNVHHRGTEHTERNHATLTFIGYG